MPALRRNPFFSQNRKCAQKALRLTRSQALLFRVAAVKMRGAKDRKMLGTIVGLTINSKKITTRILFEPFISFMLYVCSFVFFCLVELLSFCDDFDIICRSIQVLWSSIIRSAIQSVLSMRPNDSTIELQPVVDNVCQLYCSKIAADLQADSSHIRRQTLPEFMYSTYLFQTGEPSAAKHALTEFVSLVFYFESVSALLSRMCDECCPRFSRCVLTHFQAQPRLRTFGKFLSNAPGMPQWRALRFDA